MISNTNNICDKIRVLSDVLKDEIFYYGVLLLPPVNRRHYYIKKHYYENNVRRIQRAYYRYYLSYAYLQNNSDYFTYKSLVQDFYVTIVIFCVCYVILYNLHFELAVVTV